MTGPDTDPENARKRMAAARDTARREAFRIARDVGAQIVNRPMFGGRLKDTVRDVDPVAGAAAAARDLELAARGQARDYIRLAREAGYGWGRIGEALGLAPGRNACQEAATAADAAYTYAAGRPDTEAPWRHRSFGWTCRSCDQHIDDRSLVQGPADDEPGHVGHCPRLAAAIAAWDAEAARWDAEWEAGQ